MIFAFRNKKVSILSLKIIILHSNKGVLYRKRVFENKKEKISSHEKLLTKVGRNVDNGNASI